MAENRQSRYLGSDWLNDRHQRCSIENEIVTRPQLSEPSVVSLQSMEIVLVTCWQTPPPVKNKQTKNSSDLHDSCG